MTRYLLRSAHEVMAFRMKYAVAISKYRHKYLEWVSTLPIWEWSDLRLPKGNEAFIIGILCLLYTDDEINITFNSSCTQIMRNPRSDQEQQAYWDSQPKPRKKLDMGKQYGQESSDH